MTQKMKMLVLEHGSESQLGLFGEWAARRGHSLTVLEAHRLSEWPDPEGAEAIVSFGSYASVYDGTETWIAEEIEFLGAAHRQCIPILGICFGAQALAVALGGHMMRALGAAVGWDAPRIRDSELIPPGPWFRWHEDIFSVPPGARELANWNETPLAFQLGHSIGLQFHPEAEEDLVQKWIASAQDRSTALPVDAQSLMRETACAGSATRAYALFDAIAKHWSRGDIARI